MADDQTTEVRVALVLNGGISLAVWMSGVVRELDLVSRASRGIPITRTASQSEDEFAADQEHYALWQEIAREQNRTIVVDIIAGTSAGGLNGTILGTALACGKDLPDLKRMWRQTAELAPDKLLWETDDTPVDSVLDGGYFADTVASLLSDLCREPHGAHAAHDMTVFVTATALGRQGRTFRDAAKAEFEVADHRCLYRFRARRGDAGDTRPDRNDFADGRADLVLAARASAGFPGAFEPVPESATLAARRYPRWTQPAPDTPPAYLVDGGVLDNAPIEPVIEEITHRTITGRIERVLAFVVPSNGVAPQVAAMPPTGRAPAWPTVLGSAILELPKESDFRHDVERLVAALGDQRTRLNTSTTLLHSALFGTDADTCRDGLATAARTLLAPYRAARVDGSLRDIRIGIAERTRAAPVLRATRAPAPDTTLHAVWVPHEPPPEHTAWSAAPWPFGFSGALRTLGVLRSDVRQRIDNGAPHVELATTLGGIRTEIAGRHVRAVEAIYAAVAGFDSEAADWDDRVIEEIATVFTEQEVGPRLTALVGDALDEYATKIGGSAAVLGEVLVAVEIVTGAVAGRSEEQAPPPFEFVRVGPDVESALFGAQDDTKLYGTGLGHFGAFGKREWRDSDYTWGRLDAASHVAKLLEANDVRRHRLERQVLEAEGWADDDAFRASLPGRRNLLDVLRADASGRAMLHGVGDAVLRLLAAEGLPVRVPRALLRAGLGLPPDPPPASGLGHRVGTRLWTSSSAATIRRGLVAVAEKQLRQHRQHLYRWAGQGWRFGIQRLLTRGLGPSGLRPSPRDAARSRPAAGP